MLDASLHTHSGQVRYALQVTTYSLVPIDAACALKLLEFCRHTSEDPFVPGTGRGTSTDPQRALLGMS